MVGAPAGRERDACGVGFVARDDGRISREVVDVALEALRRVRHRGAVAADGESGDGAGMLVPIPRAFLERAVGGLRIDPASVGVASLFVRGDIRAAVRLVEEACREEGIDVVAWRRVPIEPSAIGGLVRSTIPVALQAMLAPPSRRPRTVAERSAFRARRRIERAVRTAGLDCYVVSCSYRTVTYKALVAADRLADCYPDLADPAFEASFAVFHQRFSTNTTPSWNRAQPFRVLCHNGEINTIDGNVAHMRAREGALGVRAIDEELLRPVVDVDGSDSAILDEVMELLTREGQVAGGARDARHAMAMLVPAAWERGHVDDPDVVAFYRYHAALMEPWDGPAALVFTDGVGVGAAMDRNGLRPMRFAACGDGLVVCASEAGVADTEGRGPVRRGALGPGGMLWVDPREGGLQTDPVRRVASRRPYGGWPSSSRHVAWSAAADPGTSDDDLLRRQIAHGYTREEVTMIVKAGAASGVEPTFSMGDDTPLAVLSEHPRPLHQHLRQRFAQVTNPAIDHLRERSVTSLRTLLGPRDPLLWERPRAAALIELDSCVVARSPRGAPIDATWDASTRPGGLRAALDRIAREAVEAVHEGASILVVSNAGIGPGRAPVPSLLAAGIVHRSLLEAGSRTRASIVLRADDVREAHHVACLVAVGAEVVVPALAVASVRGLAAEGRIDDEPAGAATRRYLVALEEGVLKAMARLGIATVDAYHATAALDALGLSEEISMRCFGLPCPEGGIGFDDIGRAVLAQHEAAFGGDDRRLANPGLVRYRRGGEYHAAEPDVVRALHLVVDPELARLRSTVAGVSPTAAAHALRDAVRDPSRSDRYARFATLVERRPATAPRDLLELRSAASPVAEEEVEPAAEIIRRFSGAAISHGSISREAHETLARGLRLAGARANSGEGGEDPTRFGTDSNCDIKQVASGRFGVTPSYLAHATELQIKIAQGSKPGEGGQLPAHKVTAEIASLRHTQPGVALLSPAPHHDIYSIEDLAQLIFDLRQANPRAAVSVKLVAERGVGIVAAGVVKALADVVHVSGADGGTGASPLGSIKHAGLPWELGLADVRQTLSGEGLRDRVRLRVDGGMKTGRDVVVAALLGADEYAFGTAALIAEGCLMVRSCHLDSCPVGIATQRPELRAAFAGTPEMVATYLGHVADEVRTILAGLGLRSLGEAVGRTDLLRPRSRPGSSGGFDVATVLEPPSGARRWLPATRVPARRSDLGDRLAREAWPTIDRGGIVDLEYPIANGDRAVGARLGCEIARAFGAHHPPGFARVTFRGTAGQSFGAFATDGMEFRLVGEANDSVGKGISGGRLVIVPPPEDAGRPVLVGNTALYGATGGELYVAGAAMNRFAVRNAGATAVVEGAGDHCCEYMTGGLVIVLGEVGNNAAAGMTGGELFLQAGADLERRVNLDTVQIVRPDADAIARLRAVLERHRALSGSTVAARALRAELGTSFVRVLPTMRGALDELGDETATATPRG